jgi:hypothetical protein
VSSRRSTQRSFPVPTTSREYSSPMTPNRTGGAWTCPTCTLLNEPLHLQYIACESVRPSTSVSLTSVVGSSTLAPRIATRFFFGDSKGGVTTWGYHLHWLYRRFSNSSRRHTTHALLATFEQAWVIRSSFSCCCSSEWMNGWHQLGSC